MTENKEKVEIKPGAGLGSGNAIRGSTTIFRALNFELFVKPVSDCYYNMSFNTKTFVICIRTNM